ncbi:MAG: enoyl-CoA hydratase/isomerase family protein [Acidimicrobiia bacterium]
MDIDSFETVLFETGDDHVATITLNRPEVLNGFNFRMCEEFAAIWHRVKLDDSIHAVVLRANGERAFCTGMDANDGFPPRYLPPNVWSQDDPSIYLSPKHNRVWKPLLCAVHGMVAGGAFYWLNEADIIVAADDTTFFEPHVNYGIVASTEPRGLVRRAPLGEVLRMALLGLDERMSPKRALEIGLVSEVVPRADLWSHVHELASAIAAKPPAAVQGTVRAIWESLDMTRTQALSTSMAYTQIGNPLGQAQLDPEKVRPPKWRLR